MIGVTVGSAVRRSFSLAALALAAGACDLLQDDIEEIVADRTGHMVVANTNIAFTSEFFEYEPQLAVVDAVDARPFAIELLRQRVVGLNLACEPELEASEDTLIARFVDCRIGPWLRIDGEIVARIDIEVGPGLCTSNECPTAVLWTIEDFDLEIGAVDIPALEVRPSLAGPVTLRDEVDETAPMSWDTGENFVVDIPLGTFEVRSHAEWTIDVDGCINFSVGSRLDRLQAPDDIDLEIGTIVFEAHDIHRCPNECPDDGRIRISFGTGSVLEWNYGGAPGKGNAEVDVVAPRGHSFARRLKCL
jgi:hypothetical protein